MYLSLFLFFLPRKFKHLPPITFSLLIKVKFQSQICDFFTSSASRSTFLWFSFSNCIARAVPIARFVANSDREPRNHHHQLTPLHVQNKTPLFLVSIAVRRCEVISSHRTPPSSAAEIVFRPPLTETESKPTEKFYFYLPSAS